MSELHRPITVKLCQMTGNSWSYQSCVQKFECQPNKMWRSKKSEIGAKFNVGAFWNSLSKLVHVVCREAGIKIWVQISGDP